MREPSTADSSVVVTGNRRKPVASTTFEPRECRAHGVSSTDRLRNMEDVQRVNGKVVGTDGGTDDRKGSG